jgi:hypothetical protein
MWNDSGLPLAFLITFRCYGTWLHGDSRGSTDRFNNQYKTPHIPANDSWKKYNSKQLKREPVKLGAKERAVMEQAVRETCILRNWLLRAIKC